MNRLNTVVGLTAALMSAGCASASSSGAERPAPFDGAWKVEWCEAGASGTECGGFIAYLVQTGDQLCGSHYGADARQNRMDEGDMPSITGTVRGMTGNVQIRSGRNHSLTSARLRASDGSLMWSTLGTLAAATNGEPAFIPQDDVLRQVDDAPTRSVLEEVKAACKSHARH